MAIPAHVLEHKPDGLRNRLSGIPSGRRGKWVILALWLILTIGVVPLAGRLQSVEENDAAAFLPDSAESLDVALFEEQLQQGDRMPAVVVYHRAGGLTETDLAQIERDRTALDTAFPDVSPDAVAVSDDGSAALFSIILVAGEIVEDVDLIRDTVTSGDGLEAKVTGPAGYTTDLVAVFEGADLRLIAATASVVAILLLLTYRSPFLWLIPLIAVAVANFLATAAVYLLAKEDLLTVNGQSGGLLPILVFGIGTDYALLLIARYREELRRHADKHRAMAIALRRATPAILASAGTVIVGLLCLLASDLNSYQSLGVVGSLGVVAALLSMTMVLPALLVVFGRRLFWPFVPHVGAEVREGGNVWARLGGWIGRRPRPIWAVTAIALAVMTLGVVNLDTNLAPEDQFRNVPEAIEGQQLIAESFPAGAGSPLTVIADSAASTAVEEAIRSTPDVSAVTPSGTLDDVASFSVTLDAEPGTEGAYDIVRNLRDNVHAVAGAEAKVGGPDAESLDVAQANERDLRVILPVVLVAVTVILGLLLRAIVAPLVLIATVVLSFGAALGVSVVLFEQLFGFGAVDPTVPMLGFVFLVALGIDYNIFLVSRIHEEAYAHGTREGTLRGLAATGGVITSAGLVLAATFSVLGIMPLVSMAELGFLVAFGVLLDTLIVRSILVPALAFDIDRWLWWPSALRRTRSDEATEIAFVNPPEAARRV